MGVELDDVTFVRGYYSESVAPDRRSGLPTSAALVYVDCDMYDSTVDALDYLGGVIGHGTIVGFDDYFCWSPTRSSGEQLALRGVPGRAPRAHLPPVPDHRLARHVVLRHDGPPVRTGSRQPSGSVT